MSEARPNAVLIVIAAYAALVFAVLGMTPLWLDELQQLVVGRASVADLLRWVQLNPGASPLPYLAQRAVVDVFGMSPYVVRIPAALCSIAGAPVFAALCGRFGIRSRVWATALFLALPLQFRYALEARGYSQGLLCALASLLLLLRARERGTVGSAAWYGASVALGLYFQPLTILPVFGALFWTIGERDASSRTKRLAPGAAAAGVLAFVPWYWLQREAQEASGAMSLYFFSWRQITPLGLLHELSGGGYICSTALLLAAAVGLAKLRNRRLLACVALAALAGPILVDALVNYFFAARQLLFAAPPLALCAAGGIERLRLGRMRWAGYAVLLAFFTAAAVSDYRVATVPKDDFGAQAMVLAAHLPADACVAVAPRNHEIYYLFLRPELEGRICAEPPGTARVLAVMSPYSTQAERDQLSRVLDGSYAAAAVLQSGAGEIVDYQRR
ncbi:MAG TPA: glycosyltransferase family 39 protein [Bryobacteraceae bacterium]|nr:glycosyltransferase family 39 protein [Bryobacteraceae bacterium]